MSRLTSSKDESEIYLNPPTAFPSFRIVANQTHFSNFQQSILTGSSKKTKDIEKTIQSPKTAYPRKRRLLSEPDALSSRKKSKIGPFSVDKSEEDLESKDRKHNILRYLREAFEKSKLG